MKPTLAGMNVNRKNIVVTSSPPKEKLVGGILGALRR
jgi:hypothetical protein